MGGALLEALAALPASAWTTYNFKRAGRYRHPQIHEEIVHLKGFGHPLRQIAVRNIGHEQPTLLITNDLASPAKDLFGRYAERMVIENELDADISGFHLNALSSGLPLNVDLDTTLTVLAGNCYRLLARKLPRYELATPDRLWRHFLDDTGTVVVADDHVRVGRPPRRGPRRRSGGPGSPIRWTTSSSMAAPLAWARPHSCRRRRSVPRG